MPNLSSSTLDPHRGNDLQLDPRTNYRVGCALKRETPAPIQDAPRTRIAHPQICPSVRVSSDNSHQTIWEHWGMSPCRIWRIIPVGGGVTGFRVAEPSIPFETPTSDKTRIHDRIVTGHRILTMIRILTRMLVLARILTGAPIPARSLTRIKLVRTLTRILILVRNQIGIPMLTRTPTRILTPSRIITGIQILARTLIRILMLDGNLGPEEMLILSSIRCGSKSIPHTMTQTCYDSMIAEHSSG